MVVVECVWVALMGASTDGARDEGLMLMILMPGLMAEDEVIWTTM